MYRIGTELEGKVYNFMLHQGGLGDLIAQLPAVKYVLDHHPHIGINLYVHNYAIPLCEKVFKDYKNIRIVSVEQPYDDTLSIRSPYLHKINNLSAHLTDHAFLTLARITATEFDKNYIRLEPIDVSSFNLPEKYVVITTGFTSETREWLPQYVNEVSQYCVSKGYTPVYIGKSFIHSYLSEGIQGEFKADYSNGINLIDKTDLFEAHAIMSGARVVMGLDNGLCHLAAMSHAKIIIGFTTVDPEHRLPYRNEVMGYRCRVVTPTEEELQCIHCQSNMTFADTEHSFKECYYKDYKCLALMTADKWIKELDQIL